MVTLVKTVFSGANVTGGGVSTLAFEDPVDDTGAATMLGWVQTFWTAIAGDLDEDVSINVQGDPSRYAAATGALQGVFSAAAPAGLVGVVAGNSVPRSSQALIRWGTDEVINGRMLRGRTFIPGVPAGRTTDAGGLDLATRTDFATAADGLISNSGGTLEIWHRPVAGVGGSVGLVTSASVWDQFAVLRSRRD